MPWRRPGWKIIVRNMQGTPVIPKRITGPDGFLYMYAVKWPLREYMSIYQAVEMAGGLTENAAGDFLNMAGKLEDGMKVQIPDREEAVQWSREAAAYPGISAGAAGGAVTSKINLNTAVKEQLMTLKGIGEARAEAIIAYRQEYGPFARIEDIMEVPGIKEAAFQKIKEDITV